MFCITLPLTGAELLGYLGHWIIRHLLYSKVTYIMSFQSTRLSHPLVPEPWDLFLFILCPWLLACYLIHDRPSINVLQRFSKCGPLRSRNISITWNFQKWNFLGRPQTCLVWSRATRPPGFRYTLKSENHSFTKLRWIDLNDCAYIFTTLGTLLLFTVLNCV